MTVVASAGGLPPGTRMGRYELLHRLAMGGMAELYVARQSGIHGFERTVVVKRVLPHLTEDPEFIRMFIDEARIAASLDHPNIAQVTDIDEEAGECFFAMEYVHGRNLREVLKAAPEGLSMAMALEIMIGVAAGLHHAHEALGPDGRPLGLVHRDVSPSNVMIGFNGAVKLTDFGIAKASARTSKTVGGHIKGKVGYMSPEQCRGEEVDRRSDIFSLGIVLYEATTGARAFYAPNDFAAMAKIARVDYARPRELDPQFPEALESIIARALRKDPRERYATAETMQLELEAFAEQHGHAPSNIELASFMREHFGAPPHPQTLAAVLPPPSSKGPETKSRRGVSRGVLVSAVAATAVVAGGLSFVLGASADPTADAAGGGADAGDAGPDGPAPSGEADPTAEPAEVEPVAAADPGAPAPVEGDAAVGAADAGAVAAEQSVDVDAAESDAPADDADAPDGDDAAAADAKPRKRKKKKSTKKKAKPDKGPSPYPPGYER